MPLPDKNKNKKKNSKKQENEIAEESGGQPVSGSGAGPTKGDVDGVGDLEGYHFKVEAKRTDNKSFRITEDVVKKIQLEAYDAQKSWALAIDIDGFTSSIVDNKLVVLDRDLFWRILENANENIDIE